MLVSLLHFAPFVRLGLAHLRDNYQPVTFLNPPSIDSPEDVPVWPIGSIQKLRWRTPFHSYEIRLYPNPNEETFSILDEDAGQDASGDATYHWTVAIPEAALAITSTFEFSFQEYDTSVRRPVTSGSFSVSSPEAAEPVPDAPSVLPTAAEPSGSTQALSSEHLSPTMSDDALTSILSSPSASALPKDRPLIGAATSGAGGIYPRENDSCIWMGVGVGLGGPAVVSSVVAVIRLARRQAKTG